MAIPIDCVGQKWRAAFDTLRQCILFFVDEDPGEPTEQPNAEEPDQAWLDELKAEIDETKVNYFIGMGVVV